MLPELCVNHWLVREFPKGLDQTQRRIVGTGAFFSQGTCRMKSYHLSCTQVQSIFSSLLLITLNFKTNQQ